MKRNNLQWKINQLKKMYEDSKTLDFENPIQRKSGQWNNLNSSLLIHSMLMDYPIPPIYCIREITDKINKKGNNISIYSILDGKQRLTNIFDFINGKYNLHKDTPAYERDGEEIELANKSFDELDDDTKEDILRYQFTMYSLEDASDDEIEEIFFRLNNGVALSANQKSKAKIGTELAKFIDKILEKKFFKESCNFSPAQLKKADDLCSLLQSMMLLNDGYEYKSISANDSLNYATSIKGNYSDEQQNEIEKLTDYLGEALVDQKDKFCKKINIPMLFLMARKAITNAIRTEDFYDWYKSFSEAYTPECEYAQYCSTGSIKKEKTQGRIEVMTKHFDNYFENVNNSKEPATEATEDVEDVEATEDIINE